MARSPAFQFYPGDWQRDAALRSCFRSCTRMLDGNDLHHASERALWLSVPELQADWRGDFGENDWSKRQGSFGDGSQSLRVLACSSAIPKVASSLGGWLRTRQPGVQGPKVESLG